MHSAHARPSAHIDDPTHSLPGSLSEAGSCRRRGPSRLGARSLSSTALTWPKWRWVPPACSSSNMRPLFTCMHPPTLCTPRPPACTDTRSFVTHKWHPSTKLGTVSRKTLPTMRRGHTDGLQLLIITRRRAARAGQRKSQWLLCGGAPGRHYHWHEQQLGPCIRCTHTCTCSAQCSPCFRRPRRARGRRGTARRRGRRRAG